MSITSYASTYGSQKQKHAIHKFAEQLQLQWAKALSPEHVLTLNPIKKRLNTALQRWNTVIRKPKKSRRMHHLKWKTEVSGLFDILRPTSDPDKFDHDECAFYYDQKSGARKMALSDQIDIEHEHAVEMERNEALEQLQAEEAEMVFIEDGARLPDEAVNDDLDFEDQETMPSDLNTSFTRSGSVRHTASRVDKSCQTDCNFNSTIPIRTGARNFAPKIKCALAAASSQAAVSVEQARRSFQVTSEVFFGQKYFLTADDVPKDSETESEYYNESM